VTTDPRPSGEPTIVVVPDLAAASDAAAVHIGASLTRAVAARGRADWATTGGSNPIAIYRSIVDSPLRTSIPWGQVHVWWGDDRFVPRDHPLSNVKALDDILLGIGRAEEGTAGGGPAGVDLAVDHLHPFPCAEAIGRGLGAAWCATTLAADLRAAGLPSEGGWPSFDLLMLGLGGDGHLFSVFPGSPAIGAPDLGMAIPAPTHIEPHVERVTLNPAVIGAATDVLMVATGESKATILAEIFGAWDPSRLPGQLARRAGATWILDAAAASRIDR
jgi:6-phosphogluconolactonase